jgi:threonylcarbamoyladenosine tRNA methylthiotransferase MtaB
MKKFKVVTHGCRTNQYETQGYRDQLLALGYQEVDEGEEPDICIVNSCTVTHSADVSSMRSVHRLLREHPEAKIAVTGCMAEAKQSELLQKGVALVVLNHEKEQLVNKLFPEAETLPEFSIRNFEAHTRAFVKVQDGCNSYCTYCIIPYVRGRSKSRPIQEIIDEVQVLVANGYREVVITGINVGDYQDREQTLADLMRAVDNIEGLSRLRLSSIDPDEVDDKLMRSIVEGKHCCRSMHIVLQSGSNVILKRMNRKYTRQVFLETIERLQAEDPSFTFTTDIIVGFPGETEKDFEETLEVIERVQFAKVHIFPYSPRERTRAALYSDQLPTQIIAERRERAQACADKASFLLRSGYVGKELTILTEASKEEVHIEGHSDNFLFVQVAGKGRVNEFVKVRCIGNTAQALIGERI